MTTTSTALKQKAAPYGQALSSTLAERLPQPYVYWRNLTSVTNLKKLALRRVHAMIADPESSLAVVKSARKVVGLSCWRRLPWDSEQLGFQAGRIEFLAAEGNDAQRRSLTAALLDEVISQGCQRSVRYLTARVDAGDLTLIHALENAGFELIDGIQTFTIESDGMTAGSPGASCEIRQFCPGDLDQILEIARTSYEFDRFHADPALRSHIADRINETWLRNSCLGRAADAVVVATEGDRVLAYVTCRTDPDAAGVLGVGLGTIVMVATSAHARRRGAARAATAGALEWFSSQGVRAVEVGTQLRNVPATRLYESCGFRFAAASLTFRRILD